MKSIGFKVSEHKYTNIRPRAVASSIIGGADIHIFRFCTINFFWNQLFLWFVNTNIWISAPPNYRAGYSPDSPLQLSTLATPLFDDSKSVASCRQAWCINDSTTCSKSAGINLHQIWFSQTRCNLISSAVQTPGFSPPAPAKKTPAPGKKLRLRQKTCEMLDTEVLNTKEQFIFIK